MQLSFFLKICIPCSLDGSILLTYAELSESVSIMIPSETAICYLRNTFCSLAMSQGNEEEKCLFRTAALECQLLHSNCL